MLTRSKLLFAALAAAAMMLTLVANASARSFSVSEREFEILFKEPGLRFEGGGNTITCPITLLGHFFERTIAKAAGQIGVIRHAEPLNGTRPPCTGGTITILNESLPWKVNYVGFTGRLPNIERIRLSLVGVAFRVSTGSLGCLAGTTSLKPAFGEIIVNHEAGANRGKVERLEADPNARIPLGGSFICSFAGESSFSGSGTVTNLPRTAPITVTLI